jgi:hypothetical protein
MGHVPPSLGYLANPNAYLQPPEHRGETSATDTHVR